jgi:uncharacterized protein YecT (DUF1311 family)
MKNLLPSLLVLLTGATLITTACKKDEPVRTRDDIAADSALAADLALANRDTLVIDSIGLYRPPGGAPADTSIGGPDTTAPAGARPTGTAALPATVPPAPAPTPARSSARPSPAPAPPPAAAPTRSSPPRSTPKSPAARRVTGDPCNSPTAANQQRCVSLRLAEADKRMNGVYRALITEMRRQEGVRPGQKDPASVERLRAAQRTWLVYRDTECRRRGRGTEGALWATPRVACLGEFAVSRANELADNFSRLTAR